eukprot:CAMPEP_0194090438 /NCGR_PEP_ID=MMETSP0149-20130528/39027_1 /TAXON_ID=122233 /ORGANISM="Chaetoceros debilis, Strain MM31A-1" /LENGTH=92 /DNA_ID=CAMNT_0038774677 /DNA_START=188 /DNA_END=466 /DNA_ORIENTATION=+
MRLMTTTGNTSHPAANACAIGAAANINGNMIPPGKFPAHARAIATNFATPTCAAADAFSKGRDGLTLAKLVRKSAKPCFVAENAVRCPSIGD